MTSPFTNWKKFVEKAKEQSKLEYHLTAQYEEHEFVQRRERPAATITSQLDAKKKQKIAENRRIVELIIQALEFCGKQGIGLRGTAETLTTDTNPGNFLALVKLLSWHDDVLKRHLDAPRLRNATYLSVKIENDMLKIIARNYVLKDLVDEIRDAKFYALMADEVSSHGVEVLAICIRFVDASKQVRDEFLNFSRVSRITGVVLA